MNKLAKIVIATALLTSFIQVPFSFAAFPDENSVVSKNFKQVGRALRGMRSAETAEDVAKILQKVKDYSLKNRDLIPTILDEGTPLMADYVKTMDKFLAKVDEALQLAKSGDKDGAMKITKSLKDIKKGAHEHFNVEWEK